MLHIIIFSFFRINVPGAGIIHRKHCGQLSLELLSLKKNSSKGNYLQCVLCTIQTKWNTVVKMHVADELFTVFKWSTTLCQAQH